MSRNTPPHEWTHVFHEAVTGDIVGLAPVVVLPPQLDARAQYASEGELELAGCADVYVYARVVVCGDGFEEGVEVGLGGRDG